jgi:hypothetical protein
MDWGKTLYGAFGVQHPTLSIVIAVALGGAVAGGAWWLVGVAYKEGHTSSPVPVTLPTPPTPVAASPQPSPAPSSSPVPTPTPSQSPSPTPSATPASAIPTIQAGSQSAVSVGQQGGITAGTINLNVNSMQPRVEGVNISMEQIPSPRNDAPYAIQITVQVASSIQPFAIGVLCSQEIVDTNFHVVGNAVYTSVMTGSLNRDPKKSYFLSFASPPVTPSSPLQVTIMCREPFNVLSVERIRP